MKINKIKALCKREAHCMIYAQGGGCLIGTRNAVYPAGELKINRRTIATLFDWPDVEGDIAVEEAVWTDSRNYPSEMGYSSEQELKACGVITYTGDEVRPLATDGLDGMIYFVLEDYLAAAEKTEGYTVYSLAHNAEGEPLIVVGDGMITTAIVRPLPKKTAANIRTYLQGMAELIACGWPDEDKTGKQDELDGQIEMESMMREMEDKA